jgi:two-component system sensor kinase FixL
MRSRPVATSVARLAVCVVAVLAITTLLDALPIRDPALVAVLLFLFVVLVASTLWGFRYAIVVSLLAVPAFGYLVAPAGRFSIEDSRDWFALVAFLTIGLTVSHLAGRARTEAQNAKSAEHSARRSEATLRQHASLLDLTHDTIFVRDTNDVITFWNRGAEELYGWRSEEVIGQVTHELLRTIFPAPLAEITAILVRTGRWEGELVHTKRDRTRVTVASRWSLQRDEAGRPAGTLETNNDITDRKRAEEQRERLRQLQDDLARVNRVTTMGELTASLAHEVNQPIAAARMDANTCLRWLTRDEPDLEEAREAAKRTVMDASRAAEIVSRIRLLFKKSAPDHELVDLNVLVAELVGLMRSEAAQQRVSVRTDLAVDLPYVMGDRVQLQQVLVNLMMNSIEAMKDVDGRREVTLSSRPDDRNQVVVAVADTGVGLPANEEDMFRPFVTTKPEGTGMGLAISRSIIETHGGHLWAAPSAGRGATFSFNLPAAVANQV